MSRNIRNIKQEMQDCRKYLILYSLHYTTGLDKALNNVDLVKSFYRADPKVTNNVKIDQP